MTGGLLRGTGPGLGPLADRFDPHERTLLVIRNQDAIRRRGENISAEALDRPAVRQFVPARRRAGS